MNYKCYGSKPTIRKRKNREIDDWVCEIWIFTLILRIYGLILLKPTIFCEWILVLGAVDKYRIRKKHPLPKTIWDGEETGNFLIKKQQTIVHPTKYVLMQYIFYLSLSLYSILLQGKESKCLERLLRTKSVCIQGSFVSIDPYWPYLSFLETNNNLYVLFCPWSYWICEMDIWLQWLTCLDIRHPKKKNCWLKRLDSH